MSCLSCSEEIIEISDDTKILERIINEGTEYEVLVKTNIGRLQNVVNSKKQVVIESRERSKHKDNVRLPKLEIAKFGGDPRNWKSFLDRFTSTIGCSETLSTIEKFNYLKSFLFGEALNSIMILSMTYHYRTKIMCKRWKF